MATQYGDGVLEELRGVGIEADSVGQVLELKKLDRRAAEIVAKWLLNDKVHINVREVLARALGRGPRDFVGAPLVQAYGDIEAEHVRWAIANSIEIARPPELAGWVLAKVRATDTGRPKEMLVIALARLQNDEEARSAIRDAFGEVPGHAATSLGLVGTGEDAEFLRAQLASARGWVRKEIEKAILRINKRAH